MSNSVKLFSYADVVRTAKCVSENWAIHYAGYSTSFIDSSELGNYARQLEDWVIQSKTQTAQKSTNTLGLENVNKKIDFAVSKLKKFLKFKSNERDLSNEYLAYGLVKPDKKKGSKSHPIYAMPKDNDKRSLSIGVVINKLSAAGNAFAADEYGLAHWEMLRDEHAQQWDTGGLMRAQKSAFVLETLTLFESLTAQLRRLRKQIELDFPANNVDTVLRKFGFLKEL